MTVCRGCYKRLNQKTRSAELPPQTQREAVKYTDLAAAVLNRLIEIANRLTESFVDDLSHSPHLFNHLSVYYADLLAQKFGTELDGLYQCVITNTIDVIGSSYEQWIRANSLEDDQLESF